MEEGHEAQSRDLAHHIGAHAEESGAEVGDEVAVSQHHALRYSGGAGGEGEGA